MHANKVRAKILSSLHSQISSGKIERLPDFTVTKTHEAGKALHKRRRERFRVVLHREMYSTDAYDVDTARLHKDVCEELDIDLSVVQPV